MKMKAIYTILLLFFTITFSFSQSNKFTLGELVNEKGDTIKGYIKDYDFSLDKGFMNNKIRYKKNLDDEQIVFKRSEINSILINDRIFRKIHYHIYDYESNENIKVSQIMELIIDGHILLYTYQELTSSSKAGTNYITKYYLGYKNDEIFERIKKSDFKKKIKKYIEDCSSLYKKVLDKTYKFKKLEEVIKEYNNNCL